MVWELLTGTPCRFNMIDETSKEFSVDQSLIFSKNDWLEQCIVFVANDRVYEQTLAFLESLRAHCPNVPLICIPYADDILKLELLAKIYNFKFFLDFDLKALQNVVACIYGRHVNRFRKIAAYQVPCREFMALDVDIIVRKDITKLFGRLSEECDILYTDSGFGGNYVSRDFDLIAHTIEFNTGAYVTSPSVLNYNEMIVCLMYYIDEYKEICFLPNDDQPLLSFYFDVTRRKFKNLDQIDTGFSTKLWYLHDFHHRDGDVYDPENGKPIAMVHFAGAGSHQIGKYGPFSDMFNHYLTSGRNRVAGCMKYLHGNPIINFVESPLL